MTTIVPFQPSRLAQFQFQATLDGNLYTISCPWNLYRQGYYCRCADLSGNVLFFLPLIGSPPDYDINLAGGYFVTSTLVFRQASQTFEVSP